MSVYDAIGGEELVAAAVERFYGRLRADPVIGEFFADADIAKLKTHQRMFLTAALGGPDAYEGRDMRAAHAHLHITDADFDLFLGYLAQTLGELDLTQDRIDEVIAALDPLRQQIVVAVSDSSDEWGSQDPTGGGD